VSVRQHGKRGALPRDRSVPLPVFEHFLSATAPLPPAPPVVDRCSDVTSWPMYLNDELEDCTSAGMLHLLSAMTAASGQTPGGVSFTNGTAQSLFSATSGYVAGDAATDEGTTLASVCSFMMSRGVTDTAGKLHKIAGFAEIADPQNVYTLRRALNLFGGVYMAFELPDNAEDYFDQDAPWTNTSQPSDPDEGHCMVLEYSNLGAPVQGKLITWGAAQPVTDAWLARYTVEAIAVASQDYVDANGETAEGYDLPQMLAYSRQVSG
jgi:hypothetical protein